MSGAAQIVVVGSCNRDHVWRVDRFPQSGETRLGHGFATGPGGKGFNQAIACHRQGAATLFIAAIGRDALGADAQADAAAKALPCRWQVHDDCATAATAVWVDDRGNNCIVVNSGANARLDARFVRAQADAFAQARVLLTQGETGMEAVAAALRLAGQHGMIRMLNPAPVHADLTHALLREADIVTPNETEFAMLCRRFLDTQIDGDAVASMDNADLHALARRLGVATVVVTLGAQGCFVSHDDAQRRDDDAACYREPAPSAKAVDTTGAGDCFSGALAAAMLRLEGRPFVDMIRHAGRAAALSTERAGAAASMPGYDETITRFGE